MDIAAMVFALVAVMFSVLGLALVLRRPRAPRGTRKK